MAAERECDHCGTAYTPARSSRFCSTRWSKRGRHVRYAAKYGVSIDWYEKTFEQQNGACAICKRADPGCGKPHFNVDHDHDSGFVRGLLCWTCNAALGHMQDNREWLREAIAYLDKAEVNTQAAYDRLAEQYADVEIPQWSLDYIDKVLKGELVDDDRTTGSSSEQVAGRAL